MLRVHEHVEPQEGGGSSSRPLEKIENCLHGVREWVAPRVADKPSGSRNIVRRCIVAGQLLRNAAAAQRSARPQVPVAYIEECVWQAVRCALGCVQRWGLEETNDAKVTILALFQT